MNQCGVTAFNAARSPSSAVVARRVIAAMSVALGCAVSTALGCAAAGGLAGGAPIGDAATRAAFSNIDDSESLDGGGRRAVTVGFDLAGGRATGAPLAVAAAAALAGGEGVVVELLFCATIGVFEAPGVWP